MADPSDLADPAVPSGPEVRIRRARDRDVPEAMALFRELDRLQGPWRVFDPRPTLSADAEARYRSALADPESIHLLAEEDGAVVGMAFARVVVPSSMSDEWAAEVSNVIVLPETRDRGIGRALIREIARWAVEKDIRLLVIKTYSANEEALRFWAGLGFRPRYVQMTVPAAELAGSDLEQ